MGLFRDFLYKKDPNDEIAVEVITKLSKSIGIMQPKLDDKKNGMNDMAINYYVYTPTITDDMFSSLRDVLNDMKYKEAKVTLEDSIIGYITYKNIEFSVWIGNKNGPTSKPFIRVFRSSENN